jgi:hypothetical protein
MRATSWLSVALLVLGCVSPSDPLGHRDALEDAQKRYTDMIRWRDAEKAVQFVEPSMREQFLANASLLETLEISDYDLGEFEYGEDDTTAQVEVTYRGYSLSHLIERKVRVTQEWRRDDDHGWRVTPDLASVIAQLKGLPPR